MPEMRKNRATDQAADKVDRQAKTAGPAQRPDRGPYGGRGRGPRSFGGRRSDKPTDDFDQVMVDLARVTRVMAGGKRMRFRACLVVGNRQGKIGWAVAKGADVSLAINKAVTKAKKQILTVRTVEGTIPHRIQVKFKAAEVLLIPARKGAGIKAGGAVRTVLELSGIKDITAKMLGSNNKINNIQAVFLALNSLKYGSRNDEKTETVDKQTEEKAKN